MDNSSSSSSNSSSHLAVIPMLAFVYTVFVWSSLHFRHNHRGGEAAARPRSWWLPSSPSSSSSSTRPRPGIMCGQTKEFWFFICGLLSTLAVGVTVVNRTSRLP